MRMYLNYCVRVAQLDRASDYGSEGREFESSHARYKSLRVDLLPQGFLVVWDICKPFIMDELVPQIWIR